MPSRKTLQNTVPKIEWEMGNEFYFSTNSAIYYEILLDYLYKTIRLYICPKNSIGGFVTNESLLKLTFSYIDARIFSTVEGAAEAAEKHYKSICLT